MNTIRRQNRAPLALTALSLALLVPAIPASASAAKSAAGSAEVSQLLTAVNVKAKLIDKLGADALRIDVVVEGRTATLTGQVAKSPSQGLAEQVALSVSGVKKVENKVTVKDAEGAVGASESSVKNVALEMKVKGALLGAVGANAMKIEVEVVDGVVSLRGKIDSPETRKAALKKTRAIKGVTKVVDLLS